MSPRGPSRHIAPLGRLRSLSAQSGFWQVVRPSAAVWRVKSRASLPFPRIRTRHRVGRGLIQIHSVTAATRASAAR